jgi:hypothetical protein
VGRKIIQDVASNEELRGGTLVLHDINDETLGDMSARRLATLGGLSAFQVQPRKSRCAD